MHAVAQERMLNTYTTMYAFRISAGFSVEREPDSLGGEQSLKGSTMNDRILDQKVSITSA